MEALFVRDALPVPAGLVTEGEHLLGEFVGDPEGPTLIVFGSVHGNEAGGVKAIRRIVPKLEELSVKLQGRVFLLAGNTRALLKGIRFIDSDLNRHWTIERVARNQPDSNFQTALSEDSEERELLTILHRVLATAKNEVYGLDLHSTSAEGVPFATVGDTLRNRTFAQKFPITILLGIEEQLEGTILEYLNGLGCVTLGFEGGQHFAESTTDSHEALIWLALVNSDILPAGAADVAKHRRVLEKATGRQRIVEIRYRHPVRPQDGFEMRPGYDNFQPVKRGEVLAKDRGGEISAGETGLILMPLYQKLGEDGFFLGREVAPVWLRLSWVLRKMRVGGLMHWLPGVRRSAQSRETLEIDTRIAHFFPLQIFHLLGFRKRRWHGKKLVVSRRRFDTTSPFR